MKKKTPTNPSAPDIQELIFTLREQRVILDADLAVVYGVPTKALNQAVKRNISRFPPDFAFQLNVEELAGIRSQIVTASIRSQFVTGSKRNIRYSPWVFTEHGALMAANVLNSLRAVEMSLYVIRAFVKLRAELAKDLKLAKRLTEIEKTLLGHDTALRDLYQKIRPLLLEPLEPKRREIGFHAKPADSGELKGRNK